MEEGVKSMEALLLVRSASVSFSEVPVNISIFSVKLSSFPTKEGARERVRVAARN